MLRSAVVGGSDDFLRLLVEIGIDPDEQYDGGVRVLHLAAACGTPYAVRELLRLGADASAADLDGWTAMHYVASAHGFDPIAPSRVAQVEMLAAAGANVDARAKDGLTPLLVAVSAGRPDVVRALIGAGADVNARGPLRDVPANSCMARLKTSAWDGRVLSRRATPLHAAVVRSCGPEVVRMLVAAGARTDADDEQLGTPLSLATRRGCAPEVLSALVTGY